MLLAPSFTYIHEPKTGGTFVNHVVASLHGRLTDLAASRLRRPALRLGFPAASYYPELLRTRLRERHTAENRYGRVYNWNDHGTCNEIPVGRRSRTILATVRNPLEMYVSLFLFGWWQRAEYVPVYRRFIPDFDLRYPTFPDVSFREYLELLHSGCVLRASRDLDDHAGIGYLSERFVRFYFRLPHSWRGFDPDPLLHKIDDAYLAAGHYRDDMFDVRFLRTERLNQELQDFLVGNGYAPADVAFVEGLPRVVPAGTEVAFRDHSASAAWPGYYTPELEAAVRARERLIFTLFPDLTRAAGGGGPLPVKT